MVNPVAPSAIDEIEHIAGMQPRRLRAPLPCAKGCHQYCVDVVLVQVTNEFVDLPVAQSEAHC